MPRVSGKAKTRKAVAKRFKVTGTGKLLRRKRGKRHLALGKTRKRKRQLGHVTLCSDADKRNVKENLPFARTK